MLERIHVKKAVKKVGPKMEINVHNVLYLVAWHMIISVNVLNVKRKNLLKGVNVSHHVEINICGKPQVEVVEEHV